MVKKRKRRDILVFLIIFGIIFSCSTLGETKNNRLVFEREIVTLEFNGEYLDVIGEYIFKNYSNKESFIIGYPFHIDEYTSSPFDIVVLLGDNRIYYERTSENTILFKLDINKFEKKTVIVKFSQEITNKENPRIEYITKTTRMWGNPLKNAKFVIKIPKIYKIKDISFPVKKIKEENEFSVYYIDIDNFYPTINLVVNLEQENQGGEGI